MAWGTDRILVYDRSLAFLFELTPDEVTKRVRTEELNGTHELELVTSRVLHEGYRLLTVDGMGRWREHVVYKPDEGHENGKHAMGTYVCMWSLQYDLMTTVDNGVAQPGMGSDCTSEVAVRDAIGGQSIWTVGTCDVGKVDAGKGCVMVGNNAWARLKQVVATWGGEVDAVITVDSTKVVTRKVELRKHLGSTNAKRRFDWGEDLTKIHRTPDPGPYYCRILPFGRGQREYAEDDETEFDWPSDVTEEPYSSGDGWVHDNGSAFVRDPEAEAVFRTADGHGGWHYPTKEVKYDEDDPELLLNEATADIHNHTRPGVSYEADVLQFAEAGMDAQGVALGDDVQCVDYGFNPDAALRVQGRVTRMEVNELAPKSDTKLTIGDLSTSFAATLKDLIGANVQSLSSRLNHLGDDVTSITSAGTIAYVESLIQTINTEINATGGYTYLTPNEGLIVYDIAVDDPLEGYNSATHTWASQVVQIKGGNIRIADEKNSSFGGINDWKWKTVIVSGHIAAELVTAAYLTVGRIGNASNGSFWNLDTNELQIATGAQIGSTTAGTLVSDTATAKSNAAQALTDASNAAKVATNYLTFNSSNGLDIGYSTTNAKTRINGSGMEVFDGNGVSALYAGLSGSNSIVRVGRQSGSGNVVMSSEGYVDVRNASTVMAHFGYGTVYINGATTSTTGCYYDLGTRKSESKIGLGSVIFGSNCTASGKYSFAGGNESVVIGDESFAFGKGLKTSYAPSFVCGKYNQNSGFFVIGNGTSDSNRSNAFEVYDSRNIHMFSASNTGYVHVHGYLDINGSTVTASDLRLKRHVSYLGDDACEFIRELKPARFRWKSNDDGEHLGFYAQDVQDADMWGTATVVENQSRKDVDFVPLALDYQAIIAPLVAYTQQLERRIDQQQETIDRLIERIEALEGAAR